STAAALAAVPRKLTQIEKTATGGGTSPPSEDASTLTAAAAAAVTSLGALSPPLTPASADTRPTSSLDGPVLASSRSGGSEMRSSRAEAAEMCWEEAVMTPTEPPGAAAGVGT
ncbi:unnamed protein product, partial [Scytosiphon promiscuus]